jgi:predicted transcriptional regulator
MSEQADTLALVAGVASSYLRRNSISQHQIGDVVAAITTALQRASQELSGRTTAETALNGSTPGEKPTPAVSVRASVRPEYLVCLECGAKQKTLKRHLTAAHSLSPAEYRAKWNLKKDYPMSAPNYSETRSAMAKKIGLGAKGRGRGRGKGKRAAKTASAGAEG